MNWTAVPMVDVNEFLNEDGWEARSQVADDLAPRYELTLRNADLIECEAWAEVHLSFESRSTGLKVNFLFPDRVSELHRLFDWLRSASDGQSYGDLDQGWMVQAIRRGERLHFRQANGWEECREGDVLSVDRQIFLKRIEGLEASIGAEAARLEGRPDST